LAQWKIWSEYNYVSRLDYMWQSWVEIEHYSAVYFDCITTFEAL